VNTDRTRKSCKGKIRVRGETIRRGGGQEEGSIKCTFIKADIRANGKFDWKKNNKIEGEKNIREWYDENSPSERQILGKGFQKIPKKNGNSRLVSKESEEKTKY